MFECVLGQGLENTKAKGKQDEKIENIVAEYKGREHKKTTKPKPKPKPKQKTNSKNKAENWKPNA